MQYYKDKNGKWQYPHGRKSKMTFFAEKRNGLVYKNGMPYTHTRTKWADVLPEGYAGKVEIVDGKLTKYQRR